MNRAEIIRLFPQNIRQALIRSELDMEQVYEIRLRVNKPLILIYQGKEYFLTKEGSFSQRESGAYLVRTEDVKETMEYVSGYSMYAFEEEIRQGFLTVQGGHRVGIAGKVVLSGKKIKNIKYISYINLRLSHQIKGCATPILPYLIKNNIVCHTLIISPPRCGKTTLLRDLIRQISNGEKMLQGFNVGVVDERSEIAGSFQGIPQNDLGIRTDLLDACPKAEGMMMLVRSMSPDVIAVDELGAYEDIDAIQTVLHCGCKLLATVHGSSVEDIKQKPLMKKLIQEQVFERYVILGKDKMPGQVRGIFDKKGTDLYGKRKSYLC